MVFGNTNFACPGCRGHGTGFDAGELESVLKASTAGVAVTVPPVALGPGEHAAIERTRAEDPPSLDASHAVEAVAWVVSAIVGLLS